MTSGTSSPSMDDKYDKDTTALLNDPVLLSEKREVNV